MSWLSDPLTEPNVLFWGWFCLGGFLTNSGPICGCWATLGYKKFLLSPNNFTQGHLLKTEWLVADVTTVGAPNRAERTILGVILAGHFMGKSGRICGQGNTL